MKSKRFVTTGYVSSGKKVAGRLDLNKVPVMRRTLAILGPTQTCAAQLDLKEESNTRASFPFIAFRLRVDLIAPEKARPSGGTVGELLDRREIKSQVSVGLIDAMDMIKQYTDRLAVEFFLSLKGFHEASQSFHSFR